MFRRTIFSFFLGFGIFLLGVAHKIVLERMRVIAEMNHHVRNALQPILYSPFLKEEAEQVRIIHEGTQRIEWALREVLPGETETAPPGSQSSKPSNSKSAA